MALYLQILKQPSRGSSCKPCLHAYFDEVLGFFQSIINLVLAFEILHLFGVRACSHRHRSGRMREVGPCHSFQEVLSPPTVRQGLLLLLRCVWPC